MHRLFVAIRPPAAIRAILIGAMGGISGARWQSEDQLHLTLRFVGEVDRHRAGDIHAALGAVHHPSFAIALNGIGAFERRGQADTVWAGGAPHPPPKGLPKKGDAAPTPGGAARAAPGPPPPPPGRPPQKGAPPPPPGRGGAPDQRAFLPHVTLARLK